MFMGHMVDNCTWARVQTHTQAPVRAYEHVSYTVTYTGTNGGRVTGMTVIDIHSFIHTI